MSQQTNEEIAEELVDTASNRILEGSSADLLERKIKEALDTKDEQIARQSSEIVILQQANYVLGEEIKDDQEQIARLTAEVERLKHDKEIAFNVGVEQSNEIVELTSERDLLVEKLEAQKAVIEAAKVTVKWYFENDYSKYDVEAAMKNAEELKIAVNTLHSKENLK